MAARLTQSDQQSVHPRRAAETRRLAFVETPFAVAAASASLAPDAGADFAFVVNEAASQHKGLLDFDMLVQRQLAPRLPAKKCGQGSGLRVFKQHLHVDPRARRRLPT
jgi:hypothetical protein